MSGIDLTAEAINKARLVIARRWCMSSRAPDVVEDARSIVTEITPLIEAAVREKVAAEIDAVAAAARAEADDTAMARGGTRDAFIDGHRFGIQTAAQVARNGAPS